MIKLNSNNIPSGMEIMTWLKGNDLLSDNLIILSFVMEIAHAFYVAVLIGIKCSEYSFSPIIVDIL